MNLDGRQVELLDDDGVLNRHRLVDMLALDELGDVTRTRNRAAASEGFEAGVFNHAAVADLQLQLHHVTAFGRPDDSRADAWLVLGEAADVARIVVVLDNFI